MLQRHSTLVGRHQLQTTIVTGTQPAKKHRGVADRGRKQQQSRRRRQQTQRQLPDHPTLGIVETVELVHHHRVNVAQVRRSPVRNRIQQPVQQHLGHHHQHPCVGVHSPVAGDQSNRVSRVTPSLGRILQVAEFLLAQCDQWSRVVDSPPGRQGLEHRRLGNQSLAGACRSAHQNALRRLEPRQQRLLLHRVRLELQLIEITRYQLVPAWHGRHD